MDTNSLSDEAVFFGCGGSPAIATAERVGSKAAVLVRLAGEGIRVPPGFVLPVRFCQEFFARGRRLPDGFGEWLIEQVDRVGKSTGMVYGGERRPLLVAVRSGAAVSMPGMLDTILNVGLNDRTLSALICLTGNPRHAWDSYRRLIQSFSETVHGLAAHEFERFVDERLVREQAATPAELDTAALRAIAQQSLACFSSHVGQAFPQDPREQLTAAVEAVFRSWQSPRAVEYRRLRRLEHLPGTAVTIQAMVYGNLGGNSGAGVAFTRNPATGEKALYLDYVSNAQGEDVVAGRRPVPSMATLERIHPDVYRESMETAGRLEHLFADAQDIEFTVQEGRLYVLQSREAKRTALAALRIACDLVAEGLIDEATALERLRDYDLGAIQMVSLGLPNGTKPLCRGTPAGAGAASGPLALTPDSAIALAAKGAPPILVRADLVTDDIAGLAASAGIVALRGGRTSHAAVVARQLNKVCVVGCPGLTVGEGEHGCRIGDRWFSEGDYISVDGESGEIYAGKLEVRVAGPSAYLRQVERWRSRNAVTRASGR